MSLRPMTDDERRANAAKSLRTRQEQAIHKSKITAVGLPYFKVSWEFPVMQNVKVYSLLICLPGIGRARALKLLEQAGIGPARTVRACGPRQTERLFALLGD